MFFIRVGDEIIRINGEVVSNNTVRSVLRSIRPLSKVIIMLLLLLLIIMMNSGSIRLL